MRKAAEILKLQKEKVLNMWEESVKKEIKASNFTSRIALRDHLPHLMDDINRIIHRLENFDVIKDKEHYEEVYEHCIQHGRQRSSSSGYTVDQILREYIIFHRILTEVLMEEDAYSTEVGIVLKYALENAMLFSVSAFSNSLQEMRQKLIGILAHDMRNPISAAYMAISSIEHDQGKERLEVIKKMAKSSLNRSLDLIEGLLDSITLQAGEGIFMDFSEFNLVESVSTIYQEASQIYSNEIRLECGEEEVVGVFDKMMVTRVLENFISNAVKYGEWNKPVSILVENFQESVSIRVHNQGEPISEERQKEIFYFLNTTNGDKAMELRSYGMGLALVKAVSDAHSGSLEIKSNKKEGTTFSITLNKAKNSPGKKRVALNFSYNDNL
ncbi:sensor histidine kinase [Salinimicrobium terrae]|uniref:sensor histidine kinase n=1 Tax=Salinimicrobium terrae TaxID=470866 RepID=UPI0003FB1A47|nr:HAMP domain-containing sensor histidine kinase [Salinimicrobium terrae]